MDLLFYAVVLQSVKVGENMRNTKTTKDLYTRLIQMSDLHSVPEIDGKYLIWKLYKNAYIRAYCDSYDTCIEIISTSLFCPSTHWHPDEDDMLDELYSLGKKGNILVFKKSLMSTDIFYIGEADNFRLTQKKKMHWSKLIYLEQK
ncbi:MAG: hypothetical protein IJ447_03590 [Clostridia bacterium]|nr:hypothetical protein [Clostridia bacterium]